MSVFLLDDLVKATGAQLLQTGDATFLSVTTDTRKAAENSIFFALRGENFDAHKFLPQALNAGARALVIDQDWETLKDLSDKSAFTGCAILRVKDTLKALQDFSGFWRRKCRFKIVGVAGSNGKTTTKSFTETLIRAKYPALATKGSLNNHIGVPLTLLSMRPSHRVGVIEMGMNHKDELKLLTEIADPDASVVTTIAHEHIEFFGTLEAIADAEGEIFRYSRPETTKVINLDNSYTKAMRSKLPKGSKVITFSGYDASADVFLKEVVSSLDFIEISGKIGGEPGKVRVPVFGRHNVVNLMAASSLALAADVEPDIIWKNLEKCRGEWGRNQISKMPSGASVVFDAYNANLESAVALVENISRLSRTGRLVGIFAEMRELGEHSPDLHRQFGAVAGKSGFDEIWFYGAFRDSFAAGLEESSFRGKVHISEGFEESLAKDIGARLKSGDTVVLKGSRGLKLERVLTAWDLDAGYS
ncbi:MAG: UDP-N-acetylmuramoyl-tripeptide--D-alanyl-D-alanine ligase [Bdellovibrionales bacterium]|nr:UDP-N-acetylmuramoyl-tripeptide--D-alanyl-D-alanine ligase [Bdellovibrionales bacterium]